MAYIEFDNVTKEYITGEVRVLALNNTSFEINKGELVVILGPSGAGKTTALNILGGMDNATSGKVIIANKDITKYSKKELIKYRRSDIGFVFQFYNLIQNLTTLENVELATEICKRPLPPREILEKVGLKDRLNNFPSQLSGGEQQRVSIARAIAKNPKILLCDEPTGALDYNTGKQILKLLQDTARKDKMTVIIITHNAAIAPMADKVIKFKNGTVEGVVLMIIQLLLKDRMVMKTLFKESVVSVKKNFKRFLSILLIVLLGVGFFAGIKATSPDMKNTIDKYYRDTNFMDFNLISTWGIKDNDLEKLKGSGYDIQGNYEFDAIVKGETEEVIKILSYDKNDKINKVVLLDGRLPSKKMNA